MISSKEAEDRAIKAQIKHREDINEMVTYIYGYTINALERSIIRKSDKGLTSLQKTLPTVFYSETDANIVLKKVTDYLEEHGYACDTSYVYHPLMQELKALIPSHQKRFDEEILKHSMWMRYNILWSEPKDEKPLDKTMHKWYQKLRKEFINND